MIKTVDTPSSLVKKRRFHRTDSHYLAMDRILGQKSAGFLNGRDAATEFSKWKRKGGQYPGPRRFLLFFLGKFCDANRFFYFFLIGTKRWEPRKESLWSRPLGYSLSCHQLLTIVSDWRIFFIALWVISLDGLNIFGIVIGQKKMTSLTAVKSSARFSTIWKRGFLFSRLGASISASRRKFSNEKR